MKNIEVDIVIMGAGVAGLWLANILQQQGYSLLILEQDNIGGKESINACGIIHGGLKFGLNSILHSHDILQTMPSKWRDCLAGTGALNLSSVRTLSPHFYLWTEPSLTAKVATFFSSRLIHGDVKSLANNEFPSSFNHQDFKGDLYQLDDFVIHVEDLLNTLRKPVAQYIYKVSEQNFHIDSDDKHNTSAIFITAAGQEPLRIHPRKVIFSAGFGNEALLNDIGIHKFAMKKQVTQMVMLKRSQLPTIYAHCVGLGNSPRLTITTHRADDGDTIWYLGGELAEEGSTRDEPMQIQKAQEELKVLLPWLDLRGSRYKTIRCERVLPDLETFSFKSDGAFVKHIGNNILVWPCKMTLAPDMGDQVLKQFASENFLPQQPNHPERLPLLKPELAQPAWDISFK